MSLPVKKIYIDSRYRTSDSLSTSSFKFPLARSLFFPRNTVFYVEDVCIPHTWYTIEAGFNDRFYIRYRLIPLTNTQVSNGTDNLFIAVDGMGTYPFTDVTGWIDKYFTLTPGIYNATTFAAEVQARFNSQGLNGYFIVAHNALTNTISILPTGENIYFFLPTDTDLATRLNNTWTLTTYNYDIADTRSCNEVLNNHGFTSPMYSIPGLTSYPVYTSNFLNLGLVRNIYISSPNLGSFSTLGARGEANIIKKVPVTSSFGSMIVDTGVSNHDFLDCSNHCLSTIEFNIKDVKGNLIPLHGSNVSFSIAFAIRNEDGPD